MISDYKFNRNCKPSDETKNNNLLNKKATKQTFLLPSSLEPELQIHVDLSELFFHQSLGQGLPINGENGKPLLITKK